jgi:hypothetical protein
MDHHVVYWKMARREVDVSDAELASLRAQERLHEVYIEFLDGRRLRHDWDPRSGRWSPAADAAPRAA